MTPGPQNGFGVFFFCFFSKEAERAILLGVFANFEVQNVVFAW
jgi:hypothetical protein